MTLEQATQIYYINKEIKAIKQDLAKLEGSRTYLKGITYSDMPKGSSAKDITDEYNKYLDERNLLEQELNYALVRLQHERLVMERFLQTIEDAEIRLIVRLRCVNNMTWREIGEEINQERSWVSRKFYNFFDINSKSTKNTSEV